MRVAWLHDLGNTDGTGRGGAEMTADEFRAAAPEKEGVEVVYVSKDDLGLVAECDRAVVLNCGTYPEELIVALDGKPVVRYWNDVAPHGSEAVTRWLVENALNVFCSPLHCERFPWFPYPLGEPTPEEATEVRCALVPPPVDLRPFREAARCMPVAERRGAVSIAPWRGWGKTPTLAQEWARKHDVEVDYFGPGAFAPPGSEPVPYEAMPALLARYETFVYLPAALEPFCRTAVEAWAAGCKLVVNNLIGARHWMEKYPMALSPGYAAADFWRLVLER